MDSPPPSSLVIPCHSPRKPMDPNNNAAATRAPKIAARRSFRVYPAGFQVLRPRLITGTNKPVTKAVEVESLEDGQRYSIKRALRTFESSASRQIKLREVLVHESIPHHPNILRFEKAWEERGRLYIQTELCNGNLADYRRNFGILAENELYLVLLSVLKAVEHLHSLNILHLDIKPSNILIHENSCKLGDFGLAYNLAQNPTGYDEEGDRYYMAPEILNDSPTTAADIYSVGMTMLELATNVDLDNDRELIRSEKIALKWFGDLSADLIQLIKSMLMVDPLERSSAGKLLQDLQQNPRPSTQFRYLESSPTDSPPSSVEDADWDFDIAEARNLTRQLELSQISNFRSRLDFDEDDSDYCAPKKTRRNTTHELDLLPRRLTFQNMDKDVNESRVLRKRSLVTRLEKQNEDLDGVLENLRDLRQW